MSENNYESCQKLARIAERLTDTMIENRYDENDAWEIASDAVTDAYRLGVRDARDGKAEELEGHEGTPEHYRPEGGRPEAIEVIEQVLRDADLPPQQGFALGNVLKYALRAGKKGDWREDCEKAGDYAHRLVTGEWS